MPEGPECKIIAEGLDSLLSGRIIASIDIVSGRYHRHAEPKGLTAFRNALPLCCYRVHSFGKFIYFLMGSYETGCQMSIWNTLGMTGRWGTQEAQHTRTAITLDDGSRIFFDDVRNFGTFRFSLNQGELAKKLGTFGYDFLNGSSDHVSAAHLGAKLQKRDRPIVEALMDQRVCAGVGNYIKCEALYRSGISPHRTTQSLAFDELEGLLSALRHVMVSAYQARGHTMSDYRDIDGNEGSFRFKLQCYQQHADPMSNSVVREKTSNGRTTHWVPAVQK